MNCTRSAFVLLAVAAFWISPAISTQAATIYVDQSAVGLDDGTSWDNAFTDLQAALGVAILGDEIWVADGTYKPSQVGDQDASFEPIPGVVIYGGFAGDETTLEERDVEANPTILSGDLNGDDATEPTPENESVYDDNSYHVVEIFGMVARSQQIDTTAVLDGLIITGGFIPDPIENGGAGIALWGGDLVLRFCTVIGNNLGPSQTPDSYYSGGVGAGILAVGSVLSIVNCEIIGNIAGLDDGVTELVGMGGHGGALGVFDSIVYIYGTSFSLNSTGNGGNEEFMLYYPGSGGNGGAIYSEDSDIQIEYCQFEENQTGDGGNSLFSSTSGGNGGAIFATNQNNTILRIFSSEFQSNQTGSGPAFGLGDGGWGGAIFVNGTSDPYSEIPPDATIEGCLIQSNQTGSAENGFGGNGGGLALSNGFVMLVNTMLVENSTGDGEIMGGQGGGIASSGYLHLVHCTVANNTSPDLGSAAGIWSTEPVTVSPPQGIAIEPRLAVIASIIWNNKVISPGALAEYSCIGNLTPFTGSNNISEYPRFRGAGDYHLLPTSPCIDKAPDILSSIMISLVDIDGLDRPYDGDGSPSVLEFDMGADEAIYPLVSLQTLDGLIDEVGPQKTGLLRIVRQGDPSPIKIRAVWSGTAIKGIDFHTHAQPFAVNENQTERDVPVTSMDDEILEGNEDAVLTLLQGRAYRVLENQATVIIDDNEDEPLLSCTAIDPIAKEPGKDSGKIRVTRQGDTSQPMTFIYGWSGTAKKETDYTAFASPVTIPAGQSSIDLRIKVLDDLIVDDPVNHLDETVIFTLLPRQNYSLDANRSATVTIEDNDDKAPVSIETIRNTTEGSLVRGIFRLTRSGPTDESVTVYLKWGGAAQLGVDHTTHTWYSVIPAGSATKDIFIKSIEDSEVEGDEDVTLQIVPGEDYSFGSPISATVIIQDNDVGSVGIQ